MKTYYVYILSSRRRTLYVGVTNNLPRRLHEHRNKLTDGFTKRYNVTVLVYFETTNSVWAAIAREKQIKKWSRSKKIALIRASNPEWRDQAAQWFPDVSSRAAPERSEGQRGISRVPCTGSP